MASGTRFQAVSVATPTSFGVGRTIRQEDLPAFYAWASAHLLPEFDRQLNIGAAAEALWFLTSIWPFASGRSVNSFEVGINTIPVANNAPGPRPALTRQEVEARLSGVRSGDEIIVANQAQAEGATSSYAQLLWEGSSRQMPAGAEGPLEAHLRRAQGEIVKRAEERAVGASFS